MQHRSLGLAELTRDMVKSGDKVLDLGPLSCGTTQAFLSKNCQCYIEDLIEYLEELSPDDDPKTALKNHLLTKPATVKFDVVLCWDILNFLDLDVIEYLFELLSPHLKQGTIVHAMRYAGGTLPGKPRRFRLLHDFNFEFSEDQSYPQIHCRAHTTMTLLKSMKRFSLFNSLMKREGMHNQLSEYFLEYDSPVSSKQFRTGSASNVSSFFEQVNRYHQVELAGLADFIGGLSSDARVLDCGKKTARNLEYINGRCKQVFVEDLFASLTWLSRVNDNDELLFSGSMLKFDNSVQFDGVFLWDLLNYCRPEQIEQLMQILAGLMQPGARVYLIQFKTASLPATPVSFDIDGPSQVTISGDLEGSLARHSISIIEMFRLMPQFRLAGHKMGFLNDGINYQEYQLEYAPR